jgi:hypothetical protein
MAPMMASHSELNHCLPKKAAAAVQTLPHGFPIVMGSEVVTSAEVFPSLT